MYFFLFVLFTSYCYSLTRPAARRPGSIVYTSPDEPCAVRNCDESPPPKLVTVMSCNRVKYLRENWQKLVNLPFPSLLALWERRPTELELVEIRTGLSWIRAPLGATTADGQPNMQAQPVPLCRVYFHCHVKYVLDPFSEAANK